MPAAQQSVMVVESSAQMQDVFRTGLKRAGYRVLLTSDPERALTRLLQEPTAVSCVVINAQEIGPPALEVFNRFAESTLTEPIPAALLLDEPQHQWRRARQDGQPSRGGRHADHDEAAPRGAVRVDPARRGMTSPAPTLTARRRRSII